jgi:hypothetical protein
MVAIGCSGDQPDHRHGQGGQPEQGGRLHGYEPVAAKTPTNIQAVEIQSAASENDNVVSGGNVWSQAIHDFSSPRKLSSSKITTRYPTIQFLCLRSLRKAI